MLCIHFILQHSSFIRRQCSPSSYCASAHCVLSCASVALVCTLHLQFRLQETGSSVASGNHHHHYHHHPHCIDSSSSSIAQLQEIIKERAYNYRETILKRGTFLFVVCECFCLSIDIRKLKKTAQTADNKSKCVLVTTLTDCKT